MNTSSKTTLSRYNDAVTQYLQACKKRKIKHPVHSHIAKDAKITFQLIHVEGNPAVSTAVTAIKELVNVVGSSTEHAAKIATLLSQSLYHNRLYPFQFEQTDKQFKLSVTDIGLITLTPEGDSVKVDMDEQLLESFGRFGISRVMKAVPFDFESVLIEKLIQVQKDTINILL